MATPCTSSSRAARTTLSTLRSWPRWTASAPWLCSSRRITLIAASCPSNRLAAVTNRTGWTGTCSSDGAVEAMPLPDARTPACRPGARYLDVHVSYGKVLGRPSNRRHVRRAPHATRRGHRWRHDGGRHRGGVRPFRLGRVAGVHRVRARPAGRADDLRHREVSPDGVSHLADL